MKKLAVSVILLISSVAVFAQKATLALNLTKGSTYHMVTNTNMAMTQVMNGQLQNINTSLMAKMAFKVTNVMDTSYAIQVTYERIGMQMDLPNGVASFESDKNNPNDILSTVMGNMVDKPFSIVLSKTGKLLSIKGTENLSSDLFAGLPQLTALQKGAISNQVMQSFGPEAFKSNIEIGTAVFPDVKVGVNDTWLVNSAVKSNMPTKMATTFTLNKITADAYMVHGESVISPQNINEYTEVNGMPTKYNVKGTSQYDLKIDKESGWISEARINQVIKGSFEIKDNPQMPGGMIIPMTITDDQTISDN
ncbi:MAG TPA: DUF6263 family protein [Mucilaginibacter sp.]|jgi:hypothetical protein|nr:DUF6263 family protein [Mucilaginibacter sp.]